MKARLVLDPTGERVCKLVDSPTLESEIDSE